MKQRQIDASNTETTKQAGKSIHSANNQSGPPNILQAGHVVPPRGCRRISSKRQLLQSGSTRSQECGAFPGFIPKNSSFDSIPAARKRVLETHCPTVPLTQKPDFWKKSGFCLCQIGDSWGIQRHRNQLASDRRASISAFCSSSIRCTVKISSPPM